MQVNLQPQIQQRFSPQMMYALKLLQLTTVELDQEIKEKIEENPLLEFEEETTDLENELSKEPSSNEEVPEPSEESGPIESDRDKIDWDTYIQDGMPNQMDTREEAEKKEDFNILEREGASGITLTQYLVDQWHLLQMSKRTREIGEYLIGNLNDSGLLDAPLLDVALEGDVPYTEAERVLKIIQTLEPTGVGGRDLRECLMLQLESFDLRETLAYNLVANHWQDVKKRRLAAISKKLKTNQTEIGAALDVIAGLNPHPGLALSNTAVFSIHPDLVVEKIEGEYVVYLNDRNLPRLRISSAYQAILERNANSSADDKKYVRKKLTEANHFVNSIEQRRSTLLKVTNYIVKAQSKFLNGGLNHLKPMILKDVAAEIGMHLTTVSRATQGKYIQTPRGIFPLRFFFDIKLKKNTRIHSNKTDNNQLATKTVKDRIAKIIQGEDAKSPLSDQAIESILQSKEGVEIKRRTVAKYRENLGIPIARMRKKF